MIDVENKKLLPSQNVLVQNGFIEDLGSNVSAPPGAQIIDGRGKYLIPGFVDTHVHFFQSGGVYTRPDILDLRKFKPYAEEIAWTHSNMENILRRYARAGITTVVDVGSTINFLLQRDTFRLKDYVPTVYMTGPLLVALEFPGYEGLQNDGPFYVMKTEEDARNSVRKELPHKPDFIKIAYVVPGKNKDSVARSYLPLVKAAIDETRKAGLRVAVATATDAGNIGSQHVSSYFDELAFMRRGGLDMWQLLQSSTINGARAVGKETEFGSVAKGKRADMVLLSKNPLDSLANWQQVDRVIIKGVAWKPDDILKH